ncbi:MAG: glycosyltransferase family 4 protein [Nitrososphaerota archaeon]
MFSPRGGSAQVARGLAHTLAHAGVDVTLVSGSLSLPDGQSDARTFYAGIDVRPVDFTAALTAADPLCADPPLHPSYEDRPDAPDRVFASVDDATYEHLVRAWADALRGAGAAQADVLHLHHLTPLNEAARRVAPDTPVVGHLHGTELLMLEAIAAGPPVTWRYAESWARRMREWAAACRRIIVSSDSQVARARAVLGLDAERFVALPNGFDPALFRRVPVNREALWHRLLVEQPRGWSPDASPGAVAYRPDQLGSIAGGVVIVYVGRFTAVKRLPLLIAAFNRARDSFTVPASLMLVGGFPGEWEDEHPWETIQRLGARDVFLAGWHTHQELPEIFAASDVVVLPSAREQFGQVLVEGMACELPAIAVAANHGPDAIVSDGVSGWLVPPDDERALAAALIAAVNDKAERQRRGSAASTSVHARYAWPAIGRRLADEYRAVRGA